MNISVLVGLKNNLDYSQNFYKTFREVYPEVEIVFVSYGSTDGTKDWLHEISGGYRDPNLISYHEDESKTFSDTYNKAIELATKDYVVFLHNDIVVAPEFLENIEKHLHPEAVVSYTTIEPPIFAGHERPGKIIRDFGSDLKTFDKKMFLEWTKQKQPEYKDKLEPGVTFFMALAKDILVDMGGFDNLYSPMFCEDDDLITRLSLQDLDMKTSLDAIVYHFVSKTSRFSEEYQNLTRIIEERSQRNFMRKWGSLSPTHKYHIGFSVENCSKSLLSGLEPLCSIIYTNLDEKQVQEYIDEESKNTKYNLRDKIHLLQYPLDPFCPIIIEFDGNKLNNNNAFIIQNIQSMIDNLEEDEGEYQVDIFRVHVLSRRNSIKELICIPK